MKLDVIVGNPPYNNGMYLDFINRGHDFSTMYLSMIVPAKWEYYNNNSNTQAETITNRHLRDKINPYLKQIVFYKKTVDVFDIELTGGIVYFLDDHQIHQTCCLVNRSTRCESFNSTGYVKLTGTYTLLNIVNDLMSTYGPYKKIDLPGAFDHRYIVVQTNNCYSNGQRCYADYTFSPCIVIDQTKQSLGQWQVPITQFDDLDGCRSFFSYIDRSLIKLLIDCVNLRFRGFPEDHAIWDLVPDPGPFDHIFTDDELYKKYNIPVDVQEDLKLLYKSRKVMPF